jgi:hypothetical protein
MHVAKDVKGMTAIVFFDVVRSIDNFSLLNDLF